MMIRGKDVAISLLVVGTAAAAGYALQAGRARCVPAESNADIGARIVEEPPRDATVVDVASDRLRMIPEAQRAVERAVRNDAREEWEHVTLERDGAWEIVDVIRRSLPYHDDGEYNGVYVRYGDTVVLLDAIGWARVEEPLQ